MSLPNIGDEELDINRPLISSEDEQEGRDRGREDSRLLPAPKGTIVRTEHATTELQTLMHIIKGNMGTGFLSLPSAIRDAGIIVGPIALLTVAVVCVHCMKILIDTNHYLCDRLGHTFLDYGNVVEIVLEQGPVRFFRSRAFIGRWIVNIFLILTQAGYCCAFIIFMADNIQQVYQFYYSQVPSIQLFILMLLPLLVVYSWIRNLDHLAPFSFVANIFTLFGLIVIYQYLFTKLANGTSEIHNIDYFAGWGKLPIFFGTAMYTFEGIGVVLPIENKMKKPENFLWVLYWGMGIVTVLYLTMGMFGYMVIGNGLHDTITLDLPQDGLYLAVRITFVMAVFVSYAIQIYVPVDILYPSIKSRLPHKLKDYGEFAFRAFLVTITVGLAASIPKLALFISLMGSLASSALALIFPPLIQELAFYQGWHVMRRIKNMLIFAVGIVGFVFGTLVSIEGIIKAFGPSSQTPTTTAAFLFATNFGNVTAL